MLRLSSVPVGWTSTGSLRVLHRGTFRSLLVALSALGLLVLAAPPASAHIGGGAAGSNFDGRVTAITPSAPGLSVRVLQFGDEIELVNDTDQEVLGPGYSDEPYLRIGPDGVYRNSNSPATYLNLNRYATLSLPENADAAAEPDWQQLSTESHYVWHDHRTHWMSPSQLPPAVAADPTRTHTISSWTIPLEHASTELAVIGELAWSPPPSPWLIWPAVIALFLAAVTAGWPARTARPLGWLLLLAAAASVWHVATTPEPPITVARHVGAIVSAALPAAILVGAAVVGMRASRRPESSSLTGLMAIVVSWLLLSQGLPDVDALWTAVVLPTGPTPLARAAVGVLVGLGLGLLAGGVLAVRRFRDRDAEAPTELAQAAA
jgi:hypothetical protein